MRIITFMFIGRIWIFHPEINSNGALRDGCRFGLLWVYFSETSRIFP